MVQVRDLTELTLKDLWREVKDEEDWWGDLKQETLRIAKAMLEGTMEGELMERLQAGKYRRTPGRKGHRNGYRYRSLLTEIGPMLDIKVPRDREGSYYPTVLERYQHKQQRVNGLIREMFLAGVSTRRVGEVLGPLLGKAPSAQTVSRVLCSLDEEVSRFHRRSLGDGYCYLMLDGIVLKMKGEAGVKKRLVLAAYAIEPTGSRQLLSFRQATAESEAQWEAFLRDLYGRGLEGKGLQLVVTDGNAGLTEPWILSTPMYPGRGAGYIS